MAPAMPKASMPLHESHLSSIKSLLRSAADLLYDAVSIAQAAQSPQHILKLVILRRQVLNEIEDLNHEFVRSGKRD
jgi:hypothetical protein